MFDIIISKFELKSSSDNLTGGRTEIWETVLNRAKFFGNGENITGAAHNTFFSMLDQYGFIPFITWILFCISGWYRGFRLAFRDVEYTNKYLPLFAFQCFITECMTEGMMMKTIMILCVLCIPVIRYYEDNLYEHN